MTVILPPKGKTKSKPIHLEPKLQSKAQKASPQPLEVPSDESLGVFNLSGHVAYDLATNRASLILVRREVSDLWDREVKDSGPDLDQFFSEITLSGTTIVREAAVWYRPWLNDLATLPGEIRIRHIRIVIKWRSISLFVLVKI